MRARPWCWSVAAVQNARRSAAEVLNTNRSAAEVLAGAAASRLEGACRGTVGSGAWWSCCSSAVLPRDAAFCSNWASSASAATSGRDAEWGGAPGGGFVVGRRETERGRGEMERGKEERELLI
nr:unnamed protein product [Digitaria exilis]